MNTTPFHPQDYGAAAFHASYWADAQKLEFPPPRAGQFDFAIIGSGYTGLSAALELAGQGASVVVIERGEIAMGCSSRNGGFVGAGGTWLDDAELDWRYGQGAAKAFWSYGERAIELVRKRAAQWAIATHGSAEYCAVHSAAERQNIEAQGKRGSLDFREKAEGIPDFGHGVVAYSGFAIDPREYACKLAAQAKNAGAEFMANCDVTRIAGNRGAFCLSTTQGEIKAAHVIVATNGYAANGMYPKLERRIFPVRSNVIVTEPIAEADFAAIGWTSLAPIFDSRKLLHYYRRLPDRRVLFGMRGGFGYAPAKLEKIKAQNKLDFAKMFPSLAKYEVAYTWFGLLGMTANQHPFVGEIEDGLYAAFGYHGSGVALGSLSGQEIAKQAMGQRTDAPEWLVSPLKKFPHPAIMRPITSGVAAAYRLKDGKKRPVKLP